MLIKRIKLSWKRYGKWIIGSVVVPLLVAYLKTGNGGSNPPEDSVPPIEDTTSIPKEERPQKLEVHISVSPRAFTKYLEMDKIKRIADSLGKRGDYAIEFKYAASLEPHHRLKDIHYYPASKMKIAINNEILPISLSIEEIQYDDSRTVEDILEQRIDKLLTDSKERIQVYITDYIRDK